MSPYEQARSTINISTVLTGMVLASILWVGNSVDNLNKAVARIEPQIARIITIEKKLADHEIIDNERFNKVAENIRAIER